QPMPSRRRDAAGGAGRGAGERRGPARPRGASGDFRWPPPAGPRCQPRARSPPQAGPRLCPPPARSFGASRPVPAAAPDKEALLALRRRTGLPFVHCREALLRFGTDLPQ
uniref:Uncharacterized protein n=1 Tax=Anser cygnoides TaxID=8845 RepID=A0A8B9DFX9_ANSCY